MYLEADELVRFPLLSAGVAAHPRLELWIHHPPPPSTPSHPHRRTFTLTAKTTNDEQEDREKGQLRWEQRKKRRKR